MKEWFHSLAARERHAVLIGAVVVTLLLGYLLIYEPLEIGLTESQVALERKKDELKQLSDISQKYKMLGPAKITAKSNGGKSLLATIDQSSSDVGIKSAIKRLTPEGESKVRVRVESVSFDKLVEWLVINSSENLIHAELFMVRQTEKKGVVNATLLLSRY
jgi:general secretion pathway protein M